MNSYNDNLHATVIDILSNQGLELRKHRSQLEAAMFTLYNAQGAYITNAEKQKQAVESFVDKGDSLNKTVPYKHLSAMTLASASQGKSLVQQSVTKSATAAANIQVAANAILKLAGDVGSVFSVVQASDFGEDLFEIAMKCNELMGKTASLSELTSQHAMEATSLIAGIIANQVQENAEKTDEAISNLVTVLTKEFEAAKALLDTNSDALTESSKVENKAEATFEDATATSSAAISAYNLSNQKINLNLAVPREDRTSTSFTVCFDFLTSPFETKPTQLDPVESYYILLVKDSEKSTFTRAKAELLISQNGRYVEVSPTENPFASTTIHLTELNDSDGKAMQLGQQYTVFVLAVFTNAYKKTIDVFENFLTAPSAPFALTHILQHPEAGAINFDPTTNTLVFSLTEDADFNVEYRCIYLPCTTNEGNDKPGFLFNLAIAEQVGAGNYSVAAITERKTGDGKSLITGTTPITKSTTDIFGTPLIQSQMYLPVVLSYSNEVATETDQFTNSISPFTLTAPFTYHPIGLEKQ